MNSALFIDVPNIIKIKSKKLLPIHSGDWVIPDDIIDLIIKHTNSNYRVFLIGNYPNVPVRKRDKNPIETYFTLIADAIEERCKLPKKSVSFDYATDPESFEYLPLPGMLYDLAVEHEILLGFSFVVTTATIGKFIQQYSSVKPIIL